MTTLRVGSEECKELGGGDRRDGRSLSMTGLNLMKLIRIPVMMTDVADDSISMKI